MEEVKFSVGIAHVAGGALRAQQGRVPPDGKKIQDFFSSMKKKVSTSTALPTCAQTRRI